MFQLVISFAWLALVIFTLVDIITRDSGQIKHLPKVAWVFVIIFLPLIGMILWFTIGREYASRTADLGSFGDPRRAQAATTSRTEDDLAALESEIEFHEKQARIRRLEAELEARREESTGR